MPQDSVVNIACFASPVSDGEPLTTDTSANFIFGPINQPLPHGAGYVYSLDGGSPVTYIPQGSQNKVLDLIYVNLSVGPHNFKCHSISRGGLVGEEFDINWEIVSA
jgi:hypothetical protein